LDCVKWFVCAVRKRTLAARCEWRGSTNAKGVYLAFDVKRPLTAGIGETRLSGRKSMSFEKLPQSECSFAGEANGGGR
jgi:hypothetical protein